MGDFCSILKSCYFSEFSPFLLALTGSKWSQKALRFMKLLKNFYSFDFYYLSLHFSLFLFTLLDFSVVFDLISSFFLSKLQHVFYLTLLQVFSCFSHIFKPTIVPKSLHHDANTLNKTLISYYQYHVLSFLNKIIIFSVFLAIIMLFMDYILHSAHCLSSPVYSSFRAPRFSMTF